MRTLVVLPIVSYRFIQTTILKIFSFIMNVKHKMFLIALTPHHRSRFYTNRICSYVLCTFEKKTINDPEWVRIVDRKQPLCAEKSKIFVKTRFRIRCERANNKKSMFKTDRIEVLVSSRSPMPRAQSTLR